MVHFARRRQGKAGGHPRISHAFALMLLLLFYRSNPPVNPNFRVSDPVLRFGVKNCSRRELPSSLVGRYKNQCGQRRREICIKLGSIDDSIHVCAFQRWGAIIPASRGTLRGDCERWGRRWARQQGRLKRVRASTSAHLRVHEGPS